MMIKKRAHAEQGQVVVLMAAAFLFVMLGAAALTVDYGNGLFQKRRLQNVADSAALAAATELSRGASVEVAKGLAKKIVEDNGASVPSTSVYSGSELVEGIDVTIGTARVALKRSLGTFFTGLMGIDHIDVSAHAKAGLTDDGVLPIAFKRYSTGHTLAQLDGPPTNTATQTDDYLATQDSPALGDWPAPWPDPLTQKVSLEPTTLGQVKSELSWPHNQAKSGERVPLIGGDAEANFANGNDFRFWVAPDVRNITYAYPKEPELYNGVTKTTSVKDLKNLEANYFLPDYAGYGFAPNPKPGDQIAILNGVDTGKVIGPMKQYYPSGTIVTAMVYDGTVHRKPDFSVVVSQNYRTASKSDGTYPEVIFDVLIKQTNNNFPYYGSVALRVEELEGWGDWSFWDGGTKIVAPITILGADKLVQLKVTPVITAAGARTGLIRADDFLTQNVKYANAPIVLLDPAFKRFITYSTEPYKQIEQNVSNVAKATWQFDIIGVDGFGPSDITVGTGSVVWFPAEHSGVEVAKWDSTAKDVTDSKSGTIKAYVEVSTAALGGLWTVRIPLSDNDSSNNPPDVLDEDGDFIKTELLGYDQYTYMTILVIPSENASKVGDIAAFVYLLGYANFVICDDPSGKENKTTVYAYAVSDLEESPAKLGRGRPARLLPWD